MQIPSSAHGKEHKKAFPLPNDRENFRCYVQSSTFLNFLQLVNISISNYFTSNYSTCENIFFEEVFPINFHSILNFYKTFIYPRYDIEQQIMFKGNSFSVTLVWDIMGYFQLLLV